MTNKFTKRVREHAEKHGMSYQAARQQLETENDSPPEPVGPPELEPVPTDEQFGDRLVGIQASLEDPETRTTAMAQLVTERMRTRRLEIRTRYRLREAIRLGEEGDELRERHAKLEERCELLDMMLEAVKADVVEKAKGGPVDPDVLRALGWARVRDPGILAWKLPAPEDDMATEFPDEACLAWRERALALEAEVEQLRVQMAGVSVAAFGHAKGENDAKPGMYGHSVVFDDVKGLRNRHEETLALVGALWKLLDDIDTAGDVAKDDDAAYRRMVEKIQKRRWDTGVEAGQEYLYVQGWPAARKPEKWLDAYDPATSTGHEVIDQIGPEILERGFDVIVNGRKHHVKGVKISYTQVVDLAYPDGRPPYWESLTVTYSGTRTMGSMWMPGADAVRLENGMIFTAVHTGNA